MGILSGSVVAAVAGLALLPGLSRSPQDSFRKNPAYQEEYETHWEDGENGSSAEIYLMFGSLYSFP
jgi:hypothetical protein